MSKNNLPSVVTVASVAPEAFEEALPLGEEDEVHVAVSASGALFWLCFCAQLLFLIGHGVVLLEQRLIHRLWELL